jgi:aminopeptidase N
MKSTLGLLLIVASLASSVHGQTLTRQDTLRGTITPERKWWDVLNYVISVEPDYASKTIHGSNVMTFKTVEPGSVMQIDLQQPMQLDSASVNGTPVPYERDGNIYLLHFNIPFESGIEATIRLAYSGKPKEAVHPPWDGGWIWARDSKNRPWMSVACQGLGASVWYPCKDHQSDEPDRGATLRMTVADTLVAVGNGRMTAKSNPVNGKVTYSWTVKNPINNYNIIPYIGKYVHWGEQFTGEKGKLDCDYWVLDYELTAAQKQFTQVKPMLKCFEHWFGPYPFYEDGYKLVQSPHLGMEHQSAVAYGNKFANGYLGRDLSASGWGLKWDFIIVHESGHEWFGNNITSKDVADMWIHESFTNYSETLFTTCQYGVTAGNDYCIGSQRNIDNDKPIIGIYGVNKEGSGDMYPKGGSMIHNIRQLVGSDEKFRSILRGLNQTFRHQTVTAVDIEQYMSKNSGIDLSLIFKQYLTTTQIPNLEYKKEGKATMYRWTNVVDGFAMKIKLADGTWISPTTEWKKLEKQVPVKPNRNFYITVSQVN